MSTFAEAVQSTLLFRTLAAKFPGVGALPDAGYTEGGYEYAWIFARKGAR
jgi:hypothetical protein